MFLLFHCMPRWDIFHCCWLLRASRRGDFYLRLHASTRNAASPSLWQFNQYIKKMALATDRSRQRPWIDSNQQANKTSDGGFHLCSCNILQFASTTSSAHHNMISTTLGCYTQLLHQSYQWNRDSPQEYISGGEILGGRSITGESRPKIFFCIEDSLLKLKSFD